ncbi:MAG TPA: MFS transporter [Cyclobacteriaceae bacterium]|nr:MFS transporter [Cyclobacteriaceae bacterium]
MWFKKITIFAPGFRVDMDLKHKQRIFLSVYFFLSGFCFSTWASRIPTIKTFFNFNDAQLGTILLFMPISSLMGLPFSGWLVSRFESRKPLVVGFVIFAGALTSIGLAKTNFALISSICVFSFTMRIINITLNTQAATLQKKFDRGINGTFHGLWSTGGIAGVGFSTLLVALHTSIGIHFLIVALVTVSTAFYSYRFLLHSDRSASGNKLIIGKPDPYIVYLGILIFFASICEGGMFDWSGIYFREVVREELFTLGYLTFMICMALSRFGSDGSIERIGMPKMFVVSALLIFGGIALAVLLPGFWTSMFGFCLVGLGTAAIVPMTFTLASRSKKYSPGMAISLIATYGIAGTFIGPPLIGYIAHALNLRIAFVTFAIAGLMIIPVSKMFFRHKASLASQDEKP